MRLSRFPLSTSKETPADAAVVSHQLMLRGGFIRQLGSGLYSWMPIGVRVLRKIEAIVREEMNAAGAMEIVTPTVQPAELWQESGRWAQMGDEMLRIKDRHKNEFCFGPTAEEVVTFHVRQDIRSYRQLPVNYYQIQTKFRDERRPRFGVMRSREFVMKDAYSFHMTESSLAAEYDNMRAAYAKVFTRVGVDFRIVKADSGNIGGSRSEEFHILAQSGEDLLAVSDAGDYAANVEAAETRASGTPRAAATAAVEKVSTPGQKTCEQVSKFMKVALDHKVKLLVVKGAEGGLVGIALRGDHQLNEIKAAKHPKIADPFQMATPEEVKAVFGCEVGYLGPVACPIPVIADFAASEVADFVCGANEDNHHLRGANWGRDAAEPETADLRMIVEGDPSPDGVGTIKLYRGIEGGHVFQLGKKYTKAMNLTVLDENQQPVTPEMGCYGIGVTRMAAAVIEQRNDANGILWPDAIAPFRVIVCPIGLDKADTAGAVKAAAETLYAELLAAGIDTAIDDRGLRPGEMFKDADLIGIPHRIIVGAKGLATQQFEYKRRDAAGAEMIAATTSAVLEKLGG
ncbi:proline--tRNA ligase [Nevskia sp.]|uniref:proline--tRNA ligase n=1 Tax=Nevskia sp. TaxID=1929292 RepID=UPI0025DA3A34|nr:proline--tRNA ligase [Nevskia sp.]